MFSLYINEIMDRLEGIKESQTVKLIERVSELKKQGIDVIDLSFGEVRLDAPENIKNATIKSLKEGFTFYTPSLGIHELREILAEKLRRENQIEADPESEIIVTTAKYALFLAIMATTKPGDEVILPNPGYPSYEAAVKLAGCKPVAVALLETNNFHLDVEELEKKITSNTRLIIINSPHNPTGAVLSKSELEAIADIAKHHNLYVLSDEVYEKYVFDGHRHYSIASIAGKERTITVYSFSKSYAMTGWRVGYAVASRDIIRRMNLMQSHTLTCICAFAQKGAIEALKSDVNFTAYFDDNRKMIVEALNKIYGIKCRMPEGTFYAFPNVSQLGKNSTQVAEDLLEKARILTTPGSAFGEYGEGYLRLSFGVKRDMIVKAIERLKVLY
jgi:aspartate/methionine/tyrosine aminotransferase